jgi:segregation and condensation protein B
LSAIAAELDEQDDVWQLQEGPGGWRLVIRPQFAQWVRLLRDEPRPLRLSPSLMETLAVVAYRQPVTRTEIESIRGVSCDRPLSKLIEQELVAVLGRAELPGRPIEYGTTEGFLEYCGLRSLDELPSSDVLSPAQLSEWIRQATTPQQEIGDAQMGLGV